MKMEPLEDVIHFLVSVSADTLLANSRKKNPVSQKEREELVILSTLPQSGLSNLRPR